MGSNNVFRWDDFFWKPEPVNKNPSWPPWLKSPSHYLGNVWKIAIRNPHGMLYLNMSDQRVLIHLECGHIDYISDITIKTHPRIREIYISCQKCGGSGEIKMI